MAVPHAGEKVHVIQEMSAVQGPCEESSPEGPGSFPVRVLVIPWLWQEDGHEVKILAPPFDQLPELVRYSSLCLTSLLDRMEEKIPT